jgi:hypothetical protein
VLLVVFFYFFYLLLLLLLFFKCGVVLDTLNKKSSLRTVAVMFNAKK